jgi:hypothetical protein
MAELGRAQPVVAAVIGVLLTANMSWLYVDNIGTESRAARHHAHVVAAEQAKPQGFVIFGKTDSALGAPTVFAARADGTDLAPSSHPARRIDQQVRKLGNGAQGVLSHDGTRYVVAGKDVWILGTDGREPRKLTNNVTTSYPRDPVWSPDDRFVAFEWRGNLVVMRADGTSASVAYRASADRSAHEYVRVYDWTTRAATTSS